MTDRQLFGVVVRTFGLVFFMFGISATNTIVQTVQLKALYAYDWQKSAWFVVIYFLIALFLLRKADFLVDIFYQPSAPAQVE